MGKNLNHLSEEVTQVQNSPGELTPILKVKPEDGTMIRFLNHVAQGSAEGLPVFFKLFDSTGAQLPTNTNLVFLAKRPGDAMYQPVSIKENTINTWRNKTIAEQQNSENIDSTKIELKGERINIRDVDEFAVGIKSSAQVSWSDGSEFYFDRDGVTEQQLS